MLILQAMELKFLQRAWQRPELKRAQQIHATTCLLGLVSVVPCIYRNASRTGVARLLRLAAWVTDVCSHRRQVARLSHGYVYVCALQGAFALEEFCPRLPLVHAAWHCLSATAVSTVNHLLDDVEQHNAQRRGTGLRQAKQLLLTDGSVPLTA